MGTDAAHRTAFEVCDLVGLVEDQRAGRDDERGAAGRRLD